MPAPRTARIRHGGPQRTTERRGFGVQGSAGRPESIPDPDLFGVPLGDFIGQVLFFVLLIVLAFGIRPAMFTLTDFLNPREGAGVMDGNDTITINSVSESLNSLSTRSLLDE